MPTSMDFMVNVLDGSADPVYDGFDWTMLCMGMEDTLLHEPEDAQPRNR